MKLRPKISLGKVTALFLIFALISGCSREKPGEPAGPPPISLPQVRLELFSEPPSLKFPEVTPSLKESEATLDQASNYKPVMAFLGVRLSQAQKKFLNQHRFLLLPKRATSRFKGKLTFDFPENQYDEMLGLFDALGGSYAVLERQPENCRLVTPDVALHAFHKYVENSLEDLEDTVLLPLLRRFLQNAQALALEYQAKSRGKLAERYELVAAQFTVPLILVENVRQKSPKKPEGELTLPAEPEKPDDVDTRENAWKLLEKFQGKFSAHLFSKMQEEMGNIYEAKEVAISPLYGRYDPEGMLKTDYTQFTPRSHYAKSSRLRGYFRAMMYLGRNGYLLAKPEGLGDALLVAHLLASPGPGGRPLLNDWQRIMEITGFYAGAPDDLTYPEWRNFVSQTLGTERFSPGDAVNPEVLRKISQRLSDLRGPKILGEFLLGERVFSLTKEELLRRTMALRIFGQRFTFDGWILNRLTAGDEQVPVRLPSTPSALFIPAAFGDQAARKYVQEFLEKSPPSFSPEEVLKFYGRLDEVAGDIARVKEAEWFSSVGTAWLRLLSTLTASYGKGYPRYMQGQLFPLKQLQSYLGSYTELKHDTLLYAKQSYAELGNGGEEGTPPPVPKGFIEPNLAFWQTLQGLVAYTEAGFKKYGLFEGERQEFGRLNRFKSQVDFYTALARKELQSEPLTEEEYERLRTDNLSYMAQPFDPGLILEEKDLRAGLIADLHTDAVRQQVLYEATGEPYLMLALIGNENTVRLTLGVAFNHYELTGPLTTRYTDADWQRLVYEGPARLPAKNFWYDLLISK